MGRFTFFGTVVLLCLGASGGVAAVGAGTEGFASEPACEFVENTGQRNLSAVRYVMQGVGGRVGLTDRGPVFELSPQGQGGTAPESTSFRLLLEGAAPVVPTARGADHGGTMWYEAVYPGVDLEVLARPTGIKYNFHVAPGADWGVIRLRYEGIHGLSLRPDGGMEIHLNKGGAPLVDAAPYIYQDVNGERRAVTGSFRIREEMTYSFDVVDVYDLNQPLVIDPEVVWGSYLGGLGPDSANHVAVDSSGNVLIAGSTSVGSWVSGGWDTTYNGGTDIFVVKLSPAGNHLWSSVAGGSNNESVSGIAIDSNDNGYIAGSTSSSAWISGGYDTTLDGVFDGFVLKFSGLGTHLWSTYVGGNWWDNARAGVTVDGSDNVYVGGWTSSSSSWVSGGWQLVYGGGGSDGFLVKISNSGLHLWSSYIGGSMEDGCLGLTTDSDGNIFAVGDTASNSWCSGGWNTTNAGKIDGYLLKVSSIGQHMWSASFGGLQNDYPEDVTCDSSGNSYVVGSAGSSEWIDGGRYQTFGGGAQDGFVLKAESNGAFAWSSYIGGDDVDAAWGVAYGGDHAIYICGSTYSRGWVVGGMGVLFQGAIDAYVLRVDSAGNHVWSSFLGGTGSDSGADIFVGNDEKIYVCGQTYSGGWISGGYDTTLSTEGDGYVYKLRETSGQLSINLSPPEAIAAGAQWRQRYSDTWLDSGVTETDVPAGIWQVDFKELSGWIAPDRLELTVPSNGTAEAAAVYVKIPVDLFWGTYLGGSAADSANGIATGPDGSVTVTGTTASGGWVSGGGDALLDGATDAYVARLAADGSPTWSTYLGGTGDESGLAVSVDTPGTTYVTGATTSAGWVAGGWNAVQGGGTDGYLARLDATGALVWSTYLGGAGEDTGTALALDDDGNPHVAGATASGGWVSGGWNAAHAGGTDGFAAKFAPDGAHIWSTFFGGAEDDSGNALAVDAAGSVHVAGTTPSVLGFAGGALPVLPAGGTDACIVRLDPLGQYVWHACLGGRWTTPEPLWRWTRSAMCTPRDGPRRRAGPRRAGTRATTAAATSLWRNFRARAVRYGPRISAGIRTSRPGA